MMMSPSEIEEDVLLEKTERLNRVNKLIVELAGGITVFNGGLGWKEQIKYANIGEYVYTMHIAMFNKAYHMGGETE